MTKKVSDIFSCNCRNTVNASQEGPFKMSKVHCVNGKL